MGGDALPTPTSSLLDDQRSHWDRGERVPVEDYLVRQPDLRDNTEVLLDLIYSEVVLRREAGERPTPDEYVARFPTLADPIRTQFEIDVAIDSSLTQPATDIADEFHGIPEAPPGYEILQALGHGGMGVVYKARHRALDRLVALKMIRTGMFSDSAERARFASEARAVARLSHPNVIQIYEIGEINGIPFLALEYVPGDSLADLLRGPPLSPRPAAELTITLAEAIQHAHEAGIVHRDLKPANILLANSNSRTSIGDKGNDSTFVDHPLTFKPKITDFGLAKMVGSDGMTRTGEFLGTPNFAAPEQASGRTDVGPTADVYALGAILYQMLTGRPPFSGSTPLETIDLVRFAEPVPPSRIRPNLPRDLGTIILTCLRKEPARRYQTARALADDLRRFLAGQSIRARPVGAMERTAKWVRRRPAMAGMLAFLIVFMAAALTTVTWLWRKEAAAREAEQTQREQVEVQRAQTEAQREQVEEQRAGLLIANARYAWLTDDLVAARQSLTECPAIYRNDDWAYLDRACSALRLTIPGDQMVLVLAFSPDGTLLAGYTAKGEAVVWDAATGRAVFSTKLGRAITDHVFDIAFMPGNRLAVALRIPGAIREGKVQFTTELKILDARSGNNVGGWKRIGEPFELRLTPNGRWAAFMAPSSRVLSILDAETGVERHKIDVPVPSQTSVAFSNDGKLLSTRVQGTEVRLWDVETGELVRTIKASSDLPLMGLFAVGDGGRRYVGGVQRSDRPALLYAMESERELFRVQTPFAFLVGVKLSPNGRLLTAFGREQFGLPVWDLETGHERIVLHGFRSALRTLTFSHDSRELAVAYQDGRVAIWTVGAK